MRYPHTRILKNDKVYEMVKRTGISLDWVVYKGETVVAQINYERSLKANRPIYDIHYCMTKAFNGIVLYTVQYDKKHFKHTIETFKRNRVRLIPTVTKAMIQSRKASKALQKSITHIVPTSVNNS